MASICASSFSLVEPRLLELLLDLRAALQLRLLVLPAGGELVGLLLQLRQLLFQGLETLCRAAVLFLGQRGALDLELAHAAREPVELDRHGVDLDAEAAGRLVHQVDRLVRQEALGNVAVRESGRRHQRAVLDAHAVVHLVALLEAAQDRDGVLHIGRIHEHRLEPALQGLVLLDALAVLVQGGRADAVQLAARQGGLDQVARVGGALGRPRTDDGVQLVDEQHDLAGSLGDLLEQRLEALLELAAELRPRQQRAEIQGQDLAVLEAVGNVARHDAVGEPLDDGRLAHAGVAEQDRVVLGAATQHLHHATDLGVTADDRVELALGGQLGQVAAVLLEHLVLGLGVLVGHFLGTPDLLEALGEVLGVDARRVEQLAGLVVVEQCQ
jgi:hypothetical protein